MDQRATGNLDLETSVPRGIMGPRGIDPWEDPNGTKKGLRRLSFQYLIGPPRFKDEHLKGCDDDPISLDISPNGLVLDVKGRIPVHARILSLQDLPWNVLEQEAIEPFLDEFTVLSRDRGVSFDGADLVKDPVHQIRDQVLPHTRGFLDFMELPRKVHPKKGIRWILGSERLLSVIFLDLFLGLFAFRTFLLEIPIQGFQAIPLSPEHIDHPAIPGQMS